MGLGRVSGVSAADGARATAEEGLCTTTRRGCRRGGPSIWANRGPGGPREANFRPRTPPPRGEGVGGDVLRDAQAGVPSA